MSASEENLNTSQTTTTTEVPVKPRLCHLKKWPHFQGYGFNLHAERAKTGQHIGKVDADSPAESAGLLEGDRIIEVNGVNISNENHQQVVKRIRNGLETDGKFYEDEVVLLVLDSEADAYYRTKNIIVKSDFNEVIKLSTNLPTDENNNNIQEQEKPLETSSSSSTKLTDTTNTQESKSKLVSDSLSSVSQKSNGSVHIDSKSETENDTENIKTASVTSLGIEQPLTNKELVSSASNLSVSSNNQSNSSKATTPNVTTKNLTNSYTEPSHKITNQTEEEEVEEEVEENIYEQNLINRRADSNQNCKTIDPFQMSANEFKSYLKSKSRADPRGVQVDMRQKYQMFQDM